MHLDVVDEETSRHVDEVFCSSSINVPNTLSNDSSESEHESDGSSVSVLGDETDDLDKTICVFKELLVTKT